MDRPTQDVDLFTPEAGGPGAAAELVCQALQNSGFRVEVVRRPEDSAGEFAQLAVSRGEETTLLELARDWRQQPPARLDRSLPRGFVDVAAALNRYTREQLMVLPFTRDPGLRGMDFTAAAHGLDDIPAEAFTSYGLDAPEVARLRARFADWPRDVSSDNAGHRAHEAAPAPGSTRRTRYRFASARIDDPSTRASWRIAANSSTLEYSNHGLPSPRDITRRRSTPPGWGQIRPPQPPRGVLPVGPSQTATTAESGARSDCRSQFAGPISATAVIAHSSPLPSQVP